MIRRKFKRRIIYLASIGIIILSGINIYLNVDCLVCSNIGLEEDEPLVIPEPLTSQCENILHGSKNEIQNAKIYTERHAKNVTSDHQYLEDLMDCKAFKRKRMYIERPLHEEEENFPIAYAIMVYKDASQVERLFRMIYRPQNLYCLHVDAKSNSSFYNVIKLIEKCFQNVYLLPQRIRVVWSQYSLLQPVLECMKYLLKFTHWKYFINLTGQELPLKTNWELVQILKAYNNGSDVEGPIRDR